MYKQLDGNQSSYSVAYRLERLVGRAPEKESICNAIPKGVKIIYLEGLGGIGKTFLLTQAPAFITQAISAADKKSTPAQSTPVVLDIIDFYNTTVHSSLALEDAIVSRVKEQAKDSSLFTKFSNALESYRSGRGEAAEVHEAFLREFNAWVEGHYAVLCFDTVEALEYGRDTQEVIDDCEIEGRETSAVSWLREELRQLHHTTVLLAGRPTHKLYRSLKEAYRDEEWLTLCLQPLTLEEAHEYFKASEYGEGENAETIERVWLLTDGRPILLSMAIDWIHQNVGLQELYTYELDELRREKEQASQFWKEQCANFEKSLVQKIRLLASPMDAAVYYAARARKGFTADMLYQILTDKELSQKPLELNRKDIGVLVADLAQLSFVKHPHGAREGWYFLHDEMYDLVDRYIWHNDYPGYTHQAETARFIAEKVYSEEEGNGLIAEAAHAVKEAGYSADLLQARRELDILRAEQLFYQLEADPQNGYRLYQQLDAQALDQGLSEWDDMLHIEFSRFVNTFPYWAKQNGLVKQISQQNELTLAESINQDSRALWIHRFLCHGDRRKTEKIARKLLHSYPDWGKFWQAKVQVALGAALVRLGQGDSKTILRQAIANLEAPDIEGDPWAVQHYRGVAYLYLGLQARAEWSLGEAEIMYEQAQTIFRDNGEAIAAARALNNSAFILVKQGNYSKAIENAEKAVEIRDSLGDVMGKGLSLNTQAIAVDRSGYPVNAWHLATEALRNLQLAKESGYPGLDRSIAMVHLNLGRIERHRARRESPHTTDIIERNWLRAAVHLQEAEKFFAELEPYYQFDLYNQFGLLYSNWANWSFTRDQTNIGQYRDLMEKGSDYFEQADRFAHNNHLYLDQADNLEDWAWVFHLRYAYKDRTHEPMKAETLREEVFKRLNQAETLAIQTTEDPTRKGLQAHYILGNIFHQRGRFNHKFGNDIAQTLKEYAVSIAYYNQFAVSPADPLERRERVKEHTRYTFEVALGELGTKGIEKMRDDMLVTVVDRGLPVEALRKWLNELIMDLTWE